MSWPTPWPSHRTVTGRKINFWNFCRRLADCRAATAHVPAKENHGAAVPTSDSPGPQFYCGPGLKLKGEITGCDTFKVEGDVEGKVSAQHLHLSPTGKFVGTADVQDAAIEGKLDGTLNVAGRLLVRSSGRVSGKIVYGQIEIECGGEILGEVSPRTVGGDAEVTLNGSSEKKSKSSSSSASSSWNASSNASQS